MKKIIFNKRTIFSILFLNYKKLCRKNFFIIKNTNDVIIRESLWTATDLRNCDNQCINYIEEIYSKLKPNETDFLTKWGGIKFKQGFIKHALFNEVRKVISEIMYAKKVYKTYKLKGHIYIWPNQISINLFNQIDYNSILPKYIKIHPFAIIYYQIFEIIKTIYFYINLIFFSELNLLKLKKVNKKIRYDYCTASSIDEGMFQNIMSKKNLNITEEKIMNLFDQSNFLIINDNSYNSEKEVKKIIKLINDAGYTGINLGDIVNYISKYDYIINHYLDDLKFRYQLAKLGQNNIYLMKRIYEIYKYRVLWQMFYQKFSIKNITKFMAFDQHSASVVHNYNNCKTIFVYFSNTESETTNSSQGSIYYELSYMNFDYAISSSLSLEFLKSSNSEIGKYIHLGPIFSDIAVNMDPIEKSIIKKNSKIINDNKIITFFDNTYAHFGLFTYEEHILFLKSMNLISKKNPNCWIIYKPKKMVKNQELLDIIERLKKNKNFIFLNKNAHIETEELLGLADIVITYPNSSIQLETISTQKIPIIYDPNNRSKKLKSIFSDLPRMFASNEIELNTLIYYWLFDKKEKDRKNYIEYYFKHLNVINKKGDRIQLYKDLVLNKLF
tara:strand:- start:4443 stop:6278 length:1836 start_codon:yes stop_codon:yes gene_type:complete